MRKVALGIGITLLLVGVVVISIAGQVTGQTDYQLVVPPGRLRDLPYGDWYIAAEFAAGTRFFVGFEGPDMEGVHPDTTILYVNITDPTGGNTTLMIDVRVNIVTKIPEFNITVRATSDGLEAPQPQGGHNDSPIDFGGVARREGLYRVQVYMYSQPYASYYYPPDGELRYLELHEVANVTPPFVQYAVAGGAAVSLTGVGLSVWAAKSRPSKPKRGRRRR